MLRIPGQQLISDMPKRGGVGWQGRLEQGSSLTTARRWSRLDFRFIHSKTPQTAQLESKDEHLPPPCFGTYILCVQQL